MELTPRHDQVAALLVLGASETEIAERAQLSLHEVRALVASPLFRTLAEQVRQVQLARTREVDRAVTAINEALPDAVETLRDIQRGAIDQWSGARERFRAASNLLDRHPETARVTRGRSDRPETLSDPVLRYIRAVAKANTIDAVALPARSPVAIERLDDAVAAARESA